MKPEIKQQLRRNANAATSCIGCLFAIGIVPFILFFIIPGFLTLVSSGFNLDPKTNPTAIYTLIFSGVFTLFIILGILAFLKYRSYTFKNLDIYLSAAENLQIEIDPTQIVFNREIPFSGGSMAFSSPTGLGKLTKNGKTYEIFHNYELKNTPKMIKGGLSTYYSAPPITIIETSSSKNGEISFMIVKKSNLQNSYSGYQFSYRLLDLDSEHAIMDYQNNSSISPDSYKSKVNDLLGPDYLSKFSHLPGENSLLFHHDKLRLHHENFADQNDLSILISFISEISK